MRATPSYDTEYVVPEMGGTDGGYFVYLVQISTKYSRSKHPSRQAHPSIRAMSIFLTQSSNNAES